MGKIGKYKNCLSTKVILVIATALFFLFPKQALADAELTCDYPWIDIPPQSHQITKNADPVSVNVGFSETFGGIGIKLELINNNNPVPINILEARSGGGAAWQTSQINTLNNSTYFYNQAVGNSIGYQWGYNSHLQITSNDSLTTIEGTRWVPLPTDNIVDANGQGNPSTPCGAQSPPNAFDEMLPKWEVKPISTPNSGGSVIDIINSYSYRSTINEFWPGYQEVQALYMNRNVAREHNLKVYLVGTSGWIEGPVVPYDDFTPLQHGSGFDSDHTQWVQWFISDLKYALYVWNINGLDIGILIKGFNAGALLRIDFNPYEGGAFSIMGLPFTATNYSIPAGTVRTHSLQYDIGTVPQLEEIAGQYLTPVTIPGDLNLDGTIDIFDYNIMIQNFGNTTCDNVADINDDCIVNIFDYNILVENFGK